MYTVRTRVLAKPCNIYYTDLTFVEQHDTSFCTCISDYWLHESSVLGSATQLRYETKLERRASDLRESSNGICFLFFYQGSGFINEEWATPR